MHSPGASTLSQCLVFLSACPAPQMLRFPVSKPGLAHPFLIWASAAISTHLPVLCSRSTAAMLTAEPEFFQLLLEQFQLPEFSPQTRA